MPPCAPAAATPTAIMVSESGATAQAALIMPSFMMPRAVAGSGCAMTSGTLAISERA